MNGLKLQTFEKSLRDDLVVQKTLSLLSLDALKEEVEALYVTFELADKIKYKVISQKDINISIAENDLKKFWENKKELFKNPTKFTFDIVWLDTKEINVTDDEVRKFYKENSFRYTSNDGKILTFEEAKEKVNSRFKIKKGNKEMQIKSI